MRVGLDVEEQVGIAWVGVPGGGLELLRKWCRPAVFGGLEVQCCRLAAGDLH